MRTLRYFAVFLLFFISCDLGHEPIPKLVAMFYFYDARGVQTSVFPSGQDFAIGFSVRNTTNKVLTYYRGDASPDVTFRILQGDSVVASSIDGYVFIQIPSVGQLQPNESMLGWWVAPNTPVRVPKIILKPGVYEARVQFRRFDNAEVDQPPAKSFTIY